MDDSGAEPTTKPKPIVGTLGTNDGEQCYDKHDICWADQFFALDPTEKA